MAKRMRFLMVGGFLGAGKTTTLGRLAQRYQAQGLNVGIVTNDQAADLVDTHLLRSQGYDVGEVAGACFCCNFNDLTATVERLEQGKQPDIILAEPVGSCTDLVATVAQPLMRLFPERFEVGPYAVILKPSHGQKILRGERQGGFSPKAEYIFRKQLEEADLLLLNRIDELSAPEVEELEQLLAAQYPGQTVLKISAKEGEGFDTLQSALEAPGVYCRRILDLDYDTYAEGEAELGWLNAAVAATASEPFDLDELIMGIIENLRTALADSSAEVAHLKVIAMAEGAYGVANLVSSGTPAALSLPARFKAPEANLVVNARVATDPAVLEDLVKQAIAEVGEQQKLSLKIDSVQSFRPGRPVPTHRVGAEEI